MESPTKFYISKATGSAYWLEGEEVAFAPLNADGTFDIEESGITEPDAIGDELVTLTDGSQVTFKKYHDGIRELLGADTSGCMYNHDHAAEPDKCESHN